MVEGGSNNNKNERTAQVTRIELYESLGLKTACKTELLKSEKTSTADANSGVCSRDGVEVRWLF